MSFQSEYMNSIHRLNYNFCQIESQREMEDSYSFDQYNLLMKWHRFTDILLVNYLRIYSLCFITFSIR